MSGQLKGTVLFVNKSQFQ